MNAAGTDLTSALWNAAIVLGIGAVITAVLVGTAKRRGSRSVSLDVVLTLTGWFVVMSLIGLAVTLLGTFGNSWIQFPTTAIAPLSATDGGCSGMPSRDGGGTVLSCLTYDAASATILSPTAGMRWGLAAAQILSVIALVAPASAIGVVAFFALGGRPFHRMAIRSLAIGAIVVFVAGFGGDVVASITQTLTLRAVLDPEDAAYPPVIRIASTMLPLAAGLVMAALAAVFRHGARFQGENALLRVETDRLRRDTEGLV